MPSNGTLLRGTPTFTAGKFGNALATGVYQLPALASSAVGTLECWAKTTSSSGIHVAVGGHGTAPNAPWIGINGVNAAFQASGATSVGTSTPINDGLWHHLALVQDGVNYTFFVDGVAVWQFGHTAQFTPGATMAIGGLGTNTSFEWAVGGGMVDEVRFSSVVRYTGAFTPPSAPFTSDASTVALYHLESDATDSVVGITAPAQVTGLTATPGATQVGLSWTAPADNGAAITDYIVQYRTTAGPGAWTTFSDGTSTATSTTVTGLTNGTGYDFQVAAINSVGTGTYSAPASATPVVGANIAPNDANIVYSPYNWQVTGTVAKTINPGAYFRALIQGTATAISLGFDVTGVSAPLPQVSVFVDGIAVTSTAVAATVPVTLPTGPTWTKRLVEVVVKSATETATRWATQSTAVKFRGITTTPGTCTTAPIQSRGLRGLVYGDSITEGVRTLNSTATNDTDRNDATIGWAYRLTEELGAEVGVVGFGGTGILTAGSGGVPALTTSYNLLWSGQARSFTPAPDFIVINEGTNDGSGNTTTAMTTVLNALLAATPSATRIILLRPFNGTSQAANLQAARTASTAPSRVVYVDTAGWWSTADSSDSLHPYGYTNVANLAPRVAAAVRAALPGASVGSGRYINVGGVAKPVGTVIKG